MEESRDSPETVEVRGVSPETVTRYRLELEVLQEVPVFERLLLLVSQHVVLERQMRQLSN